MAKYTRQEVIARLKKEIDEGKPIIIGSAGDGFMAKLEEQGGIDIIGVYNSGWMRHYGVGSLGGLIAVCDTNRAELIREGYIKGIADITTHELTDLICGGVLPAGPERLTAAGGMGILQVVSIGGADMINFGPREEIKGKRSKVTGNEFEDEAKEPGRRIYVHHPMVTVIGTLPEEAAELANAIAERLNGAKGSTLLAIPMRGWSAYDIREPALELGWSGPGPGPFWAPSPKKNEWSLRSLTFVSELKKHIDEKDNLDVLICDKHINEKEYALFLAKALEDMLNGKWSKGLYKGISWVESLDRER